MSRRWKLSVLDSAFQHYDGYLFCGRLVKGCHNIYKFIELVHKGDVALGDISSDRRHLPVGVIHVQYKVSRPQTRSAGARCGYQPRFAGTPTVTGAAENYEPKTLTEANIWTREALHTALKEAFEEAFNKDPSAPRVSQPLPSQGSMDAYFEGKVCIGRKPVSYELQHNRKAFSYMPFIGPSEDEYWMAAICNVNVDRREVTVKVFYFLHTEHRLI
ncbi:UNVERIFIED_CONTAM: hypothetical protein FKN15_071654 [Acipenser sinensis]